jgi:hypothetical protein
MGPAVIDQKYAVIAHLDVLSALDGEAKCRLVLVDIEAGRQAGDLCVAARQWEKRTDVFSLPTDDLTVSVPVSSADASRSGMSADESVSPASVEEPSPGNPSSSAESDNREVAGSLAGLSCSADDTSPSEPPTEEAASDESSLSSTLAAPADDSPSSAGEDRKQALRARYAALTTEQKRYYTQHKPDQNDLDAVEAAIAALEFKPRDPKLNTPRPAPPAEGADIDRDNFDVIKAKMVEADAATRAWFGELVKQADTAGVDFKAQNKPSLRRYEIYRGLVHLGMWLQQGDLGPEAEMPGDNEVLLALVYAAAGGDDATRFDNVTPGHALGSLGVHEAYTFSLLVDSLLAGRIHFKVDADKRLKVA